MGIAGLEAPIEYKKGSLNYATPSMRYVEPKEDDLYLESAVAIM